MAPLYDLMCAAVYRQVDQSLPQGILAGFMRLTCGVPIGRHWLMTWD
ncbi:hypothetical protein ACQEDT_23615 [Agrobacterium pusense]